MELNSQLELKVDLEAYDESPIKALEGVLISRVDVYRRYRPNVFTIGMKLSPSRRHFAILTSANSPIAVSGTKIDGGVLPWEPMWGAADDIPGGY